MKEEDNPKPYDSIQKLINEGNLIYPIYQKYIGTSFPHHEGEVVSANPSGKYPGIYFKSKTIRSGRFQYIRVHSEYINEAIKIKPKIMDIAIFEAIFDSEKYGVKKGKTRDFAILEYTQDRWKGRGYKKYYTYEEEVSIIKRKLAYILKQERKLERDKIKDFREERWLMRHHMKLSDLEKIKNSSKMIDYFENQAASDLKRLIEIYSILGDDTIEDDIIFFKDRIRNYLS